MQRAPREAATTRDDRAQKMKEKEDKKKALAEKRAARDAARKAKKAGEGEGGDA